ncbi:uncharacterized protein SPPG_05632 [Spizellomyces punctatus DAOM BR117]|uniref:Uncharacterized protein n=1 Tax=Spizellomyces punctatus (strain DAOM BR117) TaxID=645134 RepID=A0A0L0HEI6_SPIPD|nr:uncharacterized protein SPPG_05632 [Spizellomyces punctatus DAOM BR117]KNC99389.1 hypothetical protein SPPG_05632 [Spizellomyces punctatus DAOM BR117]|eukprot:XP_016607429.1 hypothetical protein SPPG_05632 [Spizellomyces punctatus DAOM BR117]
MPLPNSIQGTYTVRRNLEVLDNFKSGKVKANSIYGESLRNKDGIVTILDLDSQMPSLSIQKNKGKYTISLAETTYVFPLIDDEHDVRLVTDDTLLITEDGLSVKPETLLQPLYRAPDSRTVSLNIDDDELKVEDEKLTVIPYNYDFPLYRDAESRTVGLQADDTLLITENGLSVNFPAPETLKKPLYRDQSVLGIKLHKSLKVNSSDELETNSSQLFKAFGAIKTSSGADMLLDIGSSWLNFGFGSLTEMTNVLGEVDTTAIRLMVDSSTFSQAGSRLSLKSPGYEQILYGNLTYGFSGSPSFTYSTTLSELRVPNVKLTGTMPAFGDSYVVSKGYMSNFFVGSQTGAVAIGPEFSNRREVGVLVDNQTIRIIGNQLVSGLIFQDFNGVSIRAGTTNDVVLSLKCEAGSCLQMVKADTIKDVLTCSNGVERLQNDIQLSLKCDANSGLAMSGRDTIRDTFTASQGVTRVGNDFRLSLTAQGPDLTLNNGVLSSNIAAGIGLQKNGAVLSANLRGINGVSVSGDLISCSLTGSDTVLRVGDMLKGNYIGLTNSYGSIVVVGNTIQYNMIPPQFISNSPNLIITGSYPIYNFTIIDPTPLSKQKDTDNTEQSDTAEVLKTDVPGGNVVVLSGATPLTTIPFPSMVSPPLTVPLAVNSILPIVSTFPWGMVFGGERQRKVERDGEGNPILDGEGNPIYEPADPVTGQPPLEPGSNVAIASDPIGGCTHLLFDTPSCYQGIKYEYPQQAINLSMLRDYDDEVIKPWVGSQITNLTSNNVTFGGNISGKLISGTRLSIAPGVTGSSAVSTYSTFDGAKSTWFGLDGMGFLGYNPGASTWLGAQDSSMFIFACAGSTPNLGLRIDTNGSSTFGKNLTVAEGDFTIGTAVNGLRSLVIRNTSTGNNACPILFLTSATGVAPIFLNGPGRTVDGGANTLTVRNDCGSVRVQALGAKGLSIAGTSGNISLDSTTVSTSPITGAFVCPGGVGIGKDVFVGGNIFASTNLKVATESFVTTAVASKQNTSPLLDAISGLSPTPNTFIMGTAGGFNVTPVSSILGGYQPILTNSSALNISSLTTSGSIIVNGASDIVFHVDNIGNGLMTGGLLVEDDLNVGGMIYLGGVEVASQQFVIANTNPISQSLSSLQTTVTNNNNSLTTALASKQPMNSTTNSIYTMTVQPDSWLYSSGGTSFENVTSAQVKSILDVATNANVSSLLSGKQSSITTSTNLSLASLTANGYLSIVNAANPTYMSLVNTASNVTWGLRVAGSSADGSNPAGGFGINCLYNNVGYLFKISNTGITQVTCTTDSTSSSTGALQVSGGMGISKNLYVGGACTPIM